MLNKVQLIGHLGQDPTLRQTSGGASVCEFSLASTERWRDKNGETKDRTEWHRVIVWGAVAETCAKYLAKGRKAYVEGKLQTREWTDKENVKRYTTEIIASNVVFIDSGRSDGGDRSGGGNQARSEPATTQADSYADNDIPF